MTSAIPVQRSTNWANKPTGSWSMNWVQINIQLMNDDFSANIWIFIYLKSSFNTYIFITYESFVKIVTSTRGSNLMNKETNRKLFSIIIKVSTACFIWQNMFDTISGFQCHYLRCCFWEVHVLNDSIDNEPEKRSRRRDDYNLAVL